jgi:hypothetical protein
LIALSASAGVQPGTGRCSAVSTDWQQSGTRASVSRSPTSLSPREGANMRTGRQPGLCSGELSICPVNTLMTPTSSSAQVTTNSRAALTFDASACHLAASVACMLASGFQPALIFFFVECRGLSLVAAKLPIRRSANQSQSHGFLFHFCCHPAS